MSPERRCEKFFSIIEARGEAVTYDEVRLKTGYSDVGPESVDLRSRFSRQVEVNMPIISAAMDTVTEGTMAIAMARLGGLGIVHRGLSVKAQSDEIRRVKFHHLSGLIPRPITVRGDMTIEQIENMRRERDFKFHTFPVMDGRGKFVGILGQSDFKYCRNTSQSAAEIMTPLNELITAAPDTTIQQAFGLMQRAKKPVLPLIDPANGQLAGIYLFSSLEETLSGRSAAFNTDAQGRLRAGAAIGVGESALERADALAEYADVIVIDKAHGDRGDVIETLKAIKQRYVDVQIVVGNVTEGDSAKRLVDAGADGIKVGQGPGSICTTRVITGIGCPQVTAIVNVVRAIEGSGVPVCADGGIKNSGDINVALGAGADTVMVGRLFAGTKEAPGHVDFQQSPPMKVYRGMGSLAAMQESADARERYLQGGASLVPEGVEAKVPYIGDLATATEQYLGGLRSGMAYVGAATIKELQMKADFYRISSAGLNESHPHDVHITRDAPNYRGRDHD